MIAKGDEGFSRNISWNANGIYIFGRNCHYQERNNHIIYKKHVTDGKIFISSKY